MTTLVARGSGTPATTGTTWATVTNAVDGTPGTNPATYATMTNATASAVATIEVTGYGFSTSIASTDTLNSVSVSVRHLESATARFTSVTYQPFDGATAIGTAQTATLSATAVNATATFAVTLAQLRSSTFKVRVTITGAASTQSRVFSLDHIDVTADYTIAPPAITQAAYGFYNDSTETGSTAYTPTATLADSYPVSNYDSDLAIYANKTGVAQSFLGNGSPLARARFYLKKTGTPDGTVTAYLYAHTGTFGTSGGRPTGSALATSSTVINATSLTTTAAWVSFDFDGSVSMTTGTPYCIVLITTNTGTITNSVQVGKDQSAQTHAGNSAEFTTAWAGGFTGDLIFEVYTNNYVADTSAGDVNLQVRARLQSTSAIDVPATDDWQLQWEKNTSGTWANVAQGEAVDSCLVAASSDASVYSTQPACGQSFTGNGKNLVRAGFQLSRFGVPNGTSTAVLYAHTGTFGTSSVPTGTALATSTTTVASTALTTTRTWFWFDFAGTYTLVNGTRYVVVCSTTNSLTVNDAVLVAVTGTNADHAGNRSIFNGSTWNVPGSNGDLVFEVDSAASTAIPYNSANLTDGAATTNRLGAGTGSFVAGKVSETGLVSDLGWTANNYTELLYSVTLKQADLAPADTLTFRVLRNGATTGLTYTQVPTITIGAGAPGPQTVNAQVANLALTGVAGTPTNAGGTTPLSVTAQVATLVLSGVAGATAAGAVTVTAQVATLALTGVAGTKTVGPITVVAQVATVALTAVTGAPTVGPLTVTAQVANLALTGVAGTKVGGPVTQPAQVATLALTAVPGVPTSGTIPPQSVTAQTATLTLTAVAGSPTSGPVAVVAQVATLALTGIAGATTGGPTTLTAQVATLTLTAVPATVGIGAFPQTRTAQFATLTLTGLAGTTVGGPVTLTATVGLLALAGVPGSASIGAPPAVRLKVGATNVSALRLGTTTVTKAFLNSVQVWPPAAVGTDVLLEPFNNFTFAPWTNPFSFFTINASGRTGNCAQCSGSGDLTYNLAAPAQVADITVGYAFQITAFLTTRELMQLRSDSDATTHINTFVNTNGSLQVTGASAFGTTAAGLIALNTWYYLEVQATLSDTLGKLTVRLNGSPVIGPLTGIDTKNGGTKTVFDSVHLRANSSGITKYDDLYITAGAGAPFKGAITVP